MPLRLTILHLAQRFLTDEDTFIIPYSFNTGRVHLPTETFIISQKDLAVQIFSKRCQDLRLSFCNGDRMLKMSGE